MSTVRWSTTPRLRGTAPGALVILLLGCCTASAQSPGETIPDGYVGGPYKVIAADFTGDQRLDLAVGYRAIGVVTIERVNRQGQLTRAALTPFTVPNAHGSRHVHNLDSHDLDRDGRPDLALAIGGSGPQDPGSIVLARNLGDGRFQSAREYRVPSEAKGIRLADLDNDGQLDLLYTARGSGYKGDLAVGKLYLRQGLDTWEFGAALQCDAGKSAYYVETADLNGDGLLDVAVPTNTIRP